MVLSAFLAGGGAGWVLGSVNEGAIAQSNRLSTAMAELIWQQRMLVKLDSAEARTALLDRMNSTIVLLGNAVRFARISDDFRSEIAERLSGEAERRRSDPPDYAEGTDVDERVRIDAEAVLASCIED